MFNYRIIDVSLCKHCHCIIIKKGFQQHGAIKARKSQMTCAILTVNLLNKPTNWRLCTEDVNLFRRLIDLTLRICMSFSY